MTLFGEIAVVDNMTLFKDILYNEWNWAVCCESLKEDANTRRSKHTEILKLTRAVNILNSRLLRVG
jgi:hypothetical protein